MSTRAAHARSHRRRLVVRLLAVLSALLVAAGLYLVGGVVLFQWRYHHVGHQLLAHEHSAIAHARASPSTCTGGNGPVADLDGVQVHGDLRAPSIGLDAPVVEGTGDAQLAVAVGHDPASVWPPSSGTAVLSAHDVTWFSQIDHLGNGAVLQFVTPCVTYQYAVTSTSVVRAGTPVYNAAGSQLVLTSCYPFTALYLTPYRYLVYADLVKVVDAASPPAREVNYPVPSVPAPPPLAAQGLGLTTNDAPLGNLTLAGTPSAAWQQSTAPLDVHEALLALYFGVLRTAEQRQPSWWAALAPGVPPAAAGPLWGATVDGNDTSVDAVLGVAGDDVTSLSLTSSPVLAGGAAPGPYHLALSAAIVHGQLELTSFQLTPAGP